MRIWLACCVISFVAGPSLAGEFPIAEEGVAKTSILISARTSDRVKSAAGTLARYLQRIAGANFAVSSGDGTRGIVVGTASDFSTLRLRDRFDSKDIRRREEYLLRSGDSRLLVIGATDLAVEHAVWDLLHRLGYRQYFPGKNWEVVPSNPDLSIDVDAFESPDYLARRIWYGYGMWDYNANPYAEWCAKNRCVNGIALSTGHAYDGIVRAARADFAAHSKFWPLRDGVRQPAVNPKPCLGNPAVRELFVQHAVAK